MKNISNRPRLGISRPEPQIREMPTQPKDRPQLSGRWIVDTDGKLTCRWDLK